MIKTVLALSLAVILPVSAQSVPIAVFYAYDRSGMDRWSIDKAMHAVLGRPEFVEAARRDTHVLEVTVSGQVQPDKGNDPKGFTFTLAFWRGGAKLGESVEYCVVKQMTDCLDQIATDIASADGIRN
jgi:hypothetical protein